MNPNNTEPATSTISLPPVPETSLPTTIDSMPPSTAMDTVVSATTMPEASPTTVPPVQEKGLDPLTTNSFMDGPEEGHEVAAPPLPALELAETAVEASVEAPATVTGELPRI